MIEEEDSEPSRIQQDPAENYQRLRDYIVHEDGLINNRVGWFIQLHSFLLATYGIVLSTAIGTFFPDGTVVPAEAKVLKLLLAGVLASMTVIGICSAFSAWRSITAAHNAITSIEKFWETNFPKANRDLFPGLTGGGKRHIHKKGGSLHHFLPAAMIVMWMLSFSVPIYIVQLAAK